MTRRAPRHARREPEKPAPDQAPGTPVNPGAWDARSWVLATPEPVVWPEAGSPDVPPRRRVTPPPPSPADRLAGPGGAAAPEAGARRRPGTAPRPASSDARHGRGASASGSPAPGRSAGDGPSAGVVGRWPVAGSTEAVSGRAGVDADGVLSSKDQAAGAPASSARRGGDGGPPRRRAAASAVRSPEAGRGQGGDPARPAAAAAPRGRGSADPVRALMRRHRGLCEQAVDPLEIAAGLEAHGVTDRAAARFRHRDVFSLAEELFVRVPRAEAAAAPVPKPAPVVPLSGRRRLVRTAAPVLPGLLCTAAVVALAATDGVGGTAVRLGVGLTGAAAVVAAAVFAVRGMPRTRTAALWACWLLAYALLGDGVLTDLLAGDRADGVAVPGPDPSLALTLACAVAPAAWCGRWFARRARSRLPASRSLGDFAAGVRPLLAAAVALFAVALVALQVALRLVVQTVRSASPGGVPHVLVEALTDGRHGWPLAATLTAEAALGVLFFAAALLATHGAPGAASAGLGAACAVEAVALGSVPAAQIHGLGAVARPVADLVAAAGPAAVPALACTAAALGLLVQAVRVLAGASAHQGRRGW